MLTLNREVVSTDTDYGTALLDQRSGRYWTLNPTAALVLRDLLSGGDPNSAAQALVDEYEVTRDTARADVERLVTELRGAGLLVVAAPQGEPGPAAQPPPGSPTAASPETPDWPAAPPPGESWPAARAEPAPVNAGQSDTGPPHAHDGPGRRANGPSGRQVLAPGPWDVTSTPATPGAGHPAAGGLAKRAARWALGGRARLGGRHAVSSRDGGRRDQGDRR